MPSRHVFFGDSDFYVPTLLFLVTWAYLPLCSQQGFCHSARDWRSALSKGCASRLSLWHLLGVYLYYKGLVFGESRQRTSSYIIIEAATTVRHQGLFLAGCENI